MEGSLMSFLEKYLPLKGCLLNMRRVVISLFLVLFTAALEAGLYF
jgi:hypothetical protein